MNCTPRPQASELEGGLLPDPLKTPRIALLVETSLASGRDILCGIAKYARNHGPWALYHEPRSLAEGLPGWLQHWEGDGIIARVQDPALAEAVQATGLPVVDVLGAVPAAGLPLVHVDDRRIAALAAEHLIERGFHHFAFLGIQAENWSEQRLEGFRLALPGPPETVPRFEVPRQLMDRSPWETQMEALARWIVQLPKPIGIMVASDQLGHHLLEACRRARILVPDDVAVVSVDNDETLCEVCNPSLSSIEAGHRLVGYKAAELLDHLLRGGERPTRAERVEPHRVITRASSDVLATSDRQVATALRIIRDLACTGLSASALIARIPTSRSVLQRRFRSETGRSIQQEIIQVRLNHARRLLAETDLPLVEVAERSGFKHREYLGAIFKAHLGKSPAEYRREVAMIGSDGRHYPLSEGG
ncbi:XylR family transcriptional regulator [Geothrix limicola]|uniref:XylR family transcriptional regulator n=1 Tax=Geothrix limicola TaxID=2927978 RepID=A0ABQ5QEY8_9BACT|nr:DNA-binding transcriptional regulator [Geothrix limicola]GLH73128.1 XylR family transcriptional regulator [Geothrix limicola]